METQTVLIYAAVFFGGHFILSKLNMPWLNQFVKPTSSPFPPAVDPTPSTPDSPFGRPGLDLLSRLTAMLSNPVTRAEALVILGVLDKTMDALGIRPLSFSSKPGEPPAKP